jgi:hypothetical protein
MTVFGGLCPLLGFIGSHEATVSTAVDRLCPRMRSLKPMDAAANLRFGANFGLMRRTKFVLFATSVPRLSIVCAITGLIATAVSNHAGRPADVCSNADSWVAKPSQAVQYRRD